MGFDPSALLSGGSSAIGTAAEGATDGSGGRGVTTEDPSYYYSGDTHPQNASGSAGAGSTSSPFAASPPPSSASSAAVGSSDDAASAGGFDNFIKQTGVITNAGATADATGPGGVAAGKGGGATPPIHAVKGDPTATIPGEDYTPWILGGIALAAVGGAVVLYNKNKKRGS